MLNPAKHTETVSQIDVLPTIAGMLQPGYRNSTLGRDLFSTDNEHAAFIMYHAPGWIGVVNDQYFYRKNIRINKEELVPAKFGVTMPNTFQSDSIKKEMGVLTDAIYQTSKWMLLHNNKD